MKSVLFFVFVTTILNPTGVLALSPRNWNWEHLWLKAGHYRGRFEGGEGASGGAEIVKILEQQDALTKVIFDEKTGYMEFDVKQGMKTKAPILDAAVNAARIRESDHCTFHFKHIRKKEWGGWF